MIRCRALGSADVSVDGGPVPAELLWRKNLALLVYLARSPKRARARDHLIGLLWPDKEEGVARHSLNEALRVLRRCAGDGGLATQADVIRLAPDALELDTDQFEALAAAGDWGGASGLVRGEFLEGFAVPGVTGFEEWLAAERTLWRARAVDALTRQADVELSRGRAAEAVGLARRALALDPTADVAVRASMRALALAGDRAAALAAYEAFAARLAADLGGTPDGESVALAERIGRERAEPRRPGRAPSVGAQSRRAPLVGREAELERLGAVWAACRGAARAAVAIVTGDAGTGKSRLADEAIARGRLDGAAVAVVRAVEADAAESWSGVFGLASGGLLDVPGVAAAAPAALAAFAARLPEWADRFGAAARGITADVPGRALRQVLRVVAAERPVLLLVDDAHWIDHDSLLALSAAARDLAAAPVCVLLTRSPHPPRPELDELQSRVGRDVDGALLRLGPLSDDVLRVLARWALPGYDDNEIDRVTRRVATDSAGLPLLAVELLHAVALGLDLGRIGGAWPRPLQTLDQTLPGELPEAVVGAVRVGFRRLSPAAQLVLAAAAVLGARVAAPVVGRATGLDAPALAAALDELEWERWLVADPRGYAFVARIVRDIVGRDLVTPGQRQRLLDAAATGPS
ncbi:MAG TPA: AAA family ATPase [Gemmatimonadales bacterium]|jgi:DNA-binding SARP family transcriptional activator|nr:AAA family ATPase [Gemmatimonadales bacterium]